MTTTTNEPAAPTSATAAASPAHLADPSGAGQEPLGVLPPAAADALSPGQTPAKPGRNWSDYLFAAPYLLLFGLFVLYPLVTGLALSVMRYDLVSPQPPSFAGLDNYAEAFADERFWQGMRASFLFVLISCPITVGVALALAAMIESVRGRRQHLYRVASFMPTVLTVSVAALVWRWFYNNDFGPLNALLTSVGLPRVGWLTTPMTAMFSLVLMTLWWTVGGPILILLAGLKNIPEHYYEAAAIDGATGVRAFFGITLPLLKPALLFVAVLNVIGGFQVFGQAFLITNGGPEGSTRVMVQYIYETAFRSYRLGYGSAMSWLLFVVIAVFALAQFRLMRDRD